MGWIEAKKRYDDGITLADQKTEDLVARRVLKGMGFVQRQLPDLERVLDIPIDRDQAVWPRVEAALYALALRSDRSGIFGSGRAQPGMFVIDVRETEAKHKLIKDMEPMFAAHKSKPHPLLLTRVKGLQESLAYFPVGVGDFDFMNAFLQPPFSVIARFGDWWIVVQETTHFIRQCGPYRLGPGATT